MKRNRRKRGKLQRPAIGAAIHGIGNMRMAAAAAPLNPADFPALRAWFAFDEGAETSLEDALYVADAARGVSNLTATVGDAAAWDVSGAFRATFGAAPTYARTATVAPAAVRTLGAQALVVEADILIPGTNTTGVIATCGRATSTTNQGWELSWNHTTTPKRFAFKAAGATAAATAVSFTLTPDSYLVDARNHILLVWDRDANDTLGEVQVWVNGSMLDQVLTFTSDPGLVTVPATAANVGALSLGADLAATPPTAGDFSCVYHNLRLWHLATIPDNFAAIAAQMADSPNALPALLNGVT